MNNDTLKQQVCDALATWIRQRPGFGQENSCASVRREVSRDKRDAETLLQAVRWRDSITGEQIIEAAKHAFSGRLKIEVNLTYPKADQVKIEYTTGQYWPTEYRKAAAAVLASTLWSHARENDVHISGEHGTAETLRKWFRKEYGSRLQRRWFN